MKFFLIMTILVSMLFSAVDINTASATELATLKKIGLKKAARIISYREKHCFKNIQELKKVKGIKKKIIKKNRGNIMASECKKQGI